MSRIRVSQHAVETIVGAPLGTIIVTKDVVEVLLPSITPDPTTPGASNVAVTQDIVEVLLLSDEADVRVTTDVIEVLIAPAAGTSTGRDVPGGPTTWGYAV